jgi:hypothetical protein
VSVRLVDAVIERGPRSPTQFRVLLVLAKHAWDDGTEARPRLDLLRHEARMGSNRATSRALTALRREGWTGIERHASRGQPTWWRINVARLKDARTGGLSAERTPPGGAKGRHQEARKDATRRHNESVLESVQSLSKDTRDEPVANSKSPATRAERRAVAASVEPPGFRAFWTAYPRHAARGEAVKSFGRAVNRDGPDVIANGVASWSTYWTAEGTEERFIPHPTTWLNQSRYLDRPPPRRMSRLQQEIADLLALRPEDEP